MNVPDQFATSTPLMMIPVDSSLFHQARQTSIGSGSRVWAGLVLVTLLLLGCADASGNTVLEGSSELADRMGPFTAHEALAVVASRVQVISRTPVLLIITSGTGITADGRSASWEFVFHFPDIRAQAIYSFEAVDPDQHAGLLRLRWRISPRADAKGSSEALPLVFLDSSEAARQLTLQGLDWATADPNITLATKRLPSGEIVWVAESLSSEFTVPFGILHGR